MRASSEPEPEPEPKHKSLRLLALAQEAGALSGRVCYTGTTIGVRYESGATGDDEG